MLVWQHPMKLWHSGLFVPLSVYLSLGFLTIGWLAFSNIVHDDSQPWYLVTDGARSWEKKNGSPIGPKSGLNQVFCHFLEFSSLVLCEIACNNSLQQRLTSSRGKIYKKNNWGIKFRPKVPKLGSKLGFLLFWFVSFP